MPDIAMHHVFGQEVLNLLPEAIRKEITAAPYNFALFGPDPWFMYKIGTSTRQGRGRRMHTTKTGAFLTGLAERAKNGTDSRNMFSYLAGFLCHYALDAAAHPYIIWQTTKTWPTKRAHRDMEHGLDILLLQKEGIWGERHPVTDHHFPKVQLPESMETDLNQVYREIYGWEGTRADLNRCYRWYRMLYREMEKPRSALTVLATVVPTHRFRSVAHASSAFLDRDIENNGHGEWHEAYAPDITHRESFGDLYDMAKSEAVRMIAAAWAYAGEGSIDAETLRQAIGNRSYLSGLDTEDPRNRTVRSLMPPEP